jgi:hypothetical protein
VFTHGIIVGDRVLVLVGVKEAENETIRTLPSGMVEVDRGYSPRRARNPLSGNHHLRHIETHPLVLQSHPSSLLAVS